MLFFRAVSGLLKIGQIIRRISIYYLTVSSVINILCGKFVSVGKPTLIHYY